MAGTRPTGADIEDGGKGAISHGMQVTSRSRGQSSANSWQQNGISVLQPQATEFCQEPNEHRVVSSPQGS